MKLDLTPLTKALTTLQAALTEYDKDKSNDFVRDSCIQRFEYCYGLSHKMLRRYLEITSDELQSIDEVTFPDLIRIASERGLLKNGWDIWTKFRDARNTTSHTYDPVKAAQVYAVIPVFYDEAVAMLAALSKGSA